MGRPNVTATPLMLVKLCGPCRVLHARTKVTDVDCVSWLFTQGFKESRTIGQVFHSVCLAISHATNRVEAVTFRKVCTFPWSNELTKDSQFCIGVGSASEGISRVHPCDGWHSCLAQGPSWTGRDGRRGGIIPEWTSDSLMMDHGLLGQFHPVQFPCSFVLRTGIDQNRRYWCNEFTRLTNLESVFANWIASCGGHALG
jgi:hypothetical protein